MLVMVMAEKLMAALRNLVIASRLVALKMVKEDVVVVAAAAALVTRVAEEAVVVVVDVAVLAIRAAEEDLVAVAADVVVSVTKVVEEVAAGEVDVVVSEEQTNHSTNPSIVQRRRTKRSPLMIKLISPFTHHPPTQF